MTDTAHKDTIILCLHKGTGLFGRIIQWASRGCYSHVSIMFPPAWPAHPDAYMVYEAREGRGVQSGVAAFLHRPDEQIDRYALDVTPEQYRAARKWLDEQVGKRYDWLSIAGFVLRRSQENRRAKEVWFCSELAAAMCIHIGRPLFLDTEPYQVTPQWLSRSPLLRRAAL